MAYFSGYKYFTEKEAIDARQSCNVAYGIPISNNDETQNWTNYQFANLNNPQFWYIISDPTLTPILGDPINFEVITNQPINE